MIPHSLTHLLPLCADILSDEEFDPYVKKIDQIDANVSELEHTVYLLDEYSKRLGTIHTNIHIYSLPSSPSFL